MLTRARAVTGALLFSFVTGCSDDGPAAAVTLMLYSVDGVVIPAPLTSAAGKPATVGSGRLQGNNWGHACGFSVGLAQGPITVVQVPACRLTPGEERIFTIRFTDSRFPTGDHTYRFIPLE
jgi:hypothetical protein